MQLRWLALCCLPALLHAQDAIQPRKTIKLFNGKNLDGWYTWSRDNGFTDAKRVFTVENKALRISGEEWGGLATKQRFRNYHLIVEWKWGGKVWPPRDKNTRDSGILVHATGEDGAYNKTWLESIESQIIEGGSGDLISVAGKNRPRITALVREEGTQNVWDKNGKPKTIDRGRINWFGRDPQWKDTLGFRGPQDLDKPVGEWNRQEVIARGDKLTYILNGVVTLECYDLSHTAGKIQLQSEGAEILFRKVELRPIKK
jgi:hypothetical protein